MVSSEGRKGYFYDNKVKARKDVINMLKQNKEFIEIYVWVSSTYGFNKKFVYDIMEDVQLLKEHQQNLADKLIAEKDIKEKLETLPHKNEI